LLSGLLAVGILETLSAPPFGRARMPPAAPILFVLALAGLVLSIVGGVKALVAISVPPQRRRGFYY
jgi:hypothetical protein